MLAGGFGNYLSIQSAVRIGLIPPLLLAEARNDKGPRRSSSGGSSSSSAGPGDGADRFWPCPRFAGSEATPGCGTTLRHDGFKEKVRVGVLRT
jgi:hypothetical protein